MSARPAVELRASGLRAPDLGSATLAVLRLAWMRLVRGRKLRLAGAATLLVVGAAIGGRYAFASEASDTAELMESAVDLAFFHLLVYLLPFLFTAGAIAEEVEGRTFAFLAMRPAGRAAITFGKYLASAAMSVLVLATGVLVLHIGVHVTDPTGMIENLEETLRWIGALAILALCYCGICLLWGSLVVQAGGLLSTLHLATLEFLFGKLGFLRVVSMNHYARVLGGLPAGGWGAEYAPDLEPWVCGVIVAVATLVFLSLAALVIRMSELGYGRA
jgi:hypothetical protein